MATHTPDDAGIERLLESAVAILDRLVAFPTISADSNLPLIEFVRGYLTGHGIASELFPDAAGAKASLWATIGDASTAGIVLSGHTDVVPVVGQSWTRPPFALTDEGERLYGRGTADMKGFLACVLAMVPMFAAYRLPLPVHLAFSYDEEIGCLGVRPMLEEIAKREPKPVGVVIGEPTSGQPVTGHKGKLAMRCDVVGRACHSAHTPDGVNAVEKAARLIVAIEDLAHDFARRGPRDDRFDPPFATAQTGVVAGGISVNVVPSRCSFSFEARSTDDAELDRFLESVFAKAARDVLPAMRAAAPEADVRFELLTRYPGLRSADDDAVVALAIAASGVAQTGVISFGSEGGLFAAAGIPAVVCGPGSMDQGHKPDEYVTRDELRRCLRFLQGIATRLSGGWPAA